MQRPLSFISPSESLRKSQFTQAIHYFEISIYNFGLELVCERKTIWLSFQRKQSPEEQHLKSDNNSTIINMTCFRSRKITPVQTISFLFFLRKVMQSNGHEEQASFIRCSATLCHLSGIRGWNHQAGISNQTS